MYYSSISQISIILSDELSLLNNYLFKMYQLNVINLKVLFWCLK